MYAIPISRKIRYSQLFSKKYYAEYVRGWVGRVKPHCSSVLINNYYERERERGREGGGNHWNTYYVRAHNTYTQTLPTNHHARAHVLRDEKANSLCMSRSCVRDKPCMHRLAFFVRVCLSTGTGRVCQKKKTCEAL